jgi:hypothetical protein
MGHQANGLGLSTTIDPVVVLPPFQIIGVASQILSCVCRHVLVASTNLKRKKYELCMHVGGLFLLQAYK